jgi:hypothetical protein
MKRSFCVLLLATLVLGSCAAAFEQAITEHFNKYADRYRLSADRDYTTPIYRTRTEGAYADAIPCRSGVAGITVLEIASAELIRGGSLASSGEAV